MATSAGPAARRCVHDYKYEGRFDTVFFSPSYFCLELYEAVDGQSVEEYDSYSEWLDSYGMYWRQTVLLCHHCLEVGGRFCYIISDCQHGLTEYNLCEDMNGILIRHGFTLESEQE